MKHIVFFLFTLFSLNSFSQDKYLICNLHGYSLNDDWIANKDSIFKLNIDIVKKKDAQLFIKKMNQLEYLRNLKCIEIYIFKENINLPTLDISKNINIESIDITNLSPNYIALNIEGMEHLDKLKFFNTEGVLNSEIVNKFESLPALKWVDLTSANLDKLPLFQVTSNIEELCLAGNLQLGSSKTLSSISNLKTLKILSLDYTGLTNLPLSFTRLNNLESLNLCHNPVNIDSAINILKVIPTLAEISLCSCNIDTIPNNIVDLASLKTLDISYNKIDNHDFKTLTCLTNLTTLNCSYNSDISNIPKDITKMRNLQVLDISGTNVTEFPEELFKLANLKELYICNLKISLDQLQELKEKLPNCIIRTIYLNY